MFERLDLILERYNFIAEKLTTALDVKEMTALMKESASISECVSLYKKYLENQKQIKSNQEIADNETDEELIMLAKEEIKELERINQEIVESLRVLLLPKDPNDDKNVIVSIKGATGGDEANIFAGDLFRMYSKYSAEKGWKVKLLDAQDSSMGGFSNIDFMITGDRVYSFLKYESGVHRVQRVPETESLGRVHTSTATVYVTPEAEEVDIDISWEDIRVDTFCSSGPGGQSVNTTKSAVRLTHIPTGIAVASQVAKSQYENKDLAFDLLKSRIYEQILEEKEAKEDSIRHSLVGRGSRAEKNRTYNYPQNRVTDHRISLTLQRLDAIMEGKLDLIILPLIDEFQRRLVAAEE